MSALPTVVAVLIVALQTALLLPPHAAAEDKPGAPAAAAAPVTPTVISKVPPAVEAEGAKPQAAAAGPSAPAAAKAPSEASDKPAAADAADPPNEAPARPAGPPKPTLVARIDLTSQTLTVEQNGSETHRFAISSGARGYETPTGTFRPSWTARMWYSRKYDDAPMPYSVFFNDGIATHGTTSTHLLGRPASHGCVRLTTANAATFYKLVHQHGMSRTRIMVTGATPRSPAIASRGSRATSSYATQPSYWVQRGRPVQSYSFAEPWRGYKVAPARPAPQPRYVYPGDRPGRYSYYGSKPLFGSW